MPALLPDITHAVGRNNTFGGLSDLRVEDNKSREAGNTHG